ncbi:MAG: tetratricopeptide repeat protein [Chitinophagaceae bacterium]
MKPKLLLIPATMAIAFPLAFRLLENNTSLSSRFTRPDYRNRNIVSCSPDWNALKTWMEEVDIPPMPGSGDLKWPIATKSDSAQFYFNQGINTYYGFHIIEAKASFKKAAKFDPASAMIYWAQALAEGPNINDVGYAASPDALIAVGKAVELSVTGTDKEKILIQAQQVRYSANSTASREKLNQLYADKMKEAYEKYPDDADIAALYADALMLQHPWDLWNINGTPKPWTPLIREVLEKLLVSHPGHPGANHYYIHVMEPSPFAAQAIPSADRLGQLTPGLSHLVHMPSHIYLRTGDYRKGVLVNENAVNSYKKYIRLYAPVTGNDFLYIIHNLHMQTNHAMMEGDSAYAMKSAIETINSIPKNYLGEPAPLGNYIQYINMTPVLVQIRFGNWNELLRVKQPDKAQIYSNVLYHFGRGMALVQQAKPADANQELAMMQRLMKDSSLRIPMSPFSAAIEGAIVAENLLAGSIALSEKKYIDAVTAFTKAVTTEDNMVYNEPRDWLLNPKHYLGNAYLEAKKFPAARQVFQNDLQINNENGWALFGLYKALQGEKKKAEANKTLTRFKKAFAKSDIELKNPVRL